MYTSKLGSKIFFDTILEHVNINSYPRKKRADLRIMRKSFFFKSLNHPPSRSPLQSYITYPYYRRAPAGRIVTIPPHTTCQHIIGRERKYINCLIIPGKLKKNIHNRIINCRSCYRASFNCIVFHKCGFTALKTAYVTALLIPAVIVRRRTQKYFFLNSRKML